MVYPPPLFLFVFFSVALGISPEILAVSYLYEPIPHESPVNATLCSNELNWGDNGQGGSGALKDPSYSLIFNATDDTSEVTCGQMYAVTQLNSEIQYTIVVGYTNLPDQPGEDRYDQLVIGTDTCLSLCREECSGNIPACDLTAFKRDPEDFTTSPAVSSSNLTFTFPQTTTDDNDPTDEESTTTELILPSILNSTTIEGGGATTTTITVIPWFVSDCVEQSCGNFQKYEDCGSSTKPCLISKDTLMELPYEDLLYSADTHFMSMKFLECGDIVKFKSLLYQKKMFYGVVANDSRLENSTLRIQSDAYLAACAYVCNGPNSFQCVNKATTCGENGAFADSSYCPCNKIGRKTIEGIPNPTTDLSTTETEEIPGKEFCTDCISCIENVPGSAMAYLSEDSRHLGTLAIVSIVSSGSEEIEVSGAGIEYGSFAAGKLLLTILTSHFLQQA